MLGYLPESPSKLLRGNSSSNWGGYHFLEVPHRFTVFDANLCKFDDHNMKLPEWPTNNISSLQVSVSIVSSRVLLGADSAAGAAACGCFDACCTQEWLHAPLFTLPCGQHSRCLNGSSPSCSGMLLNFYTRNGWSPWDVYGTLPAPCEGSGWSLSGHSFGSS